MEMSKTSNCYSLRGPSIQPKCAGVPFEWCWSIKAPMKVSVRSRCPASDRVGLIVSALDSGHYGVRGGSAHKAALDG